MRRPIMPTPRRPHRFTQIALGGTLLALCLIAVKVVSATSSDNKVQAHANSTPDMYNPSWANLQATPELGTPSVTADTTSAQAPLNKLDQQKLREADGLRKAANKTIDAVRLGASSVYEAAASLGTFQGKFPVRQQDLLVAFPADEAHLPLIQAGRQWHKVIVSAMLHM